MKKGIKIMVRKIVEDFIFECVLSTLKCRQSNKEACDETCVVLIEVLYAGGQEKLLLALKNAVNNGAAEKWKVERNIYGNNDKSVDEYMMKYYCRNNGEDEEKTI